MAMATSPLSFSSKTPPHSSSAEQIVLASLLMIKKDLEETMGDLSEELFYRHAHKRIYQAILNLITKDKEVDLLTVAEELKRNNHLESIGGERFLNSLTQYVHTTESMDTHVRILKEYSMRRGILEVGHDLFKKGYQADVDVFDLLAEGENALFKLGQSYLQGEYTSLGDAMDLSRFRKKESSEASHAVYSGFPSLDRMTGGLRPGNLVILAARPSVGKTAFALSVLHNLAIRQEVKVGLFSMEMSIIELANRWISMEASILHESIHMGRLGDADLRKIAAHEKNILSPPVFIDETASLSILELSTRARRMCAKEGVKLIIVDYLQLMQGDVRKGRDPSPEERISDISRQLKNLAKSLQIPIIVLSQLNREIDRRGGERRPILSDLRGSGAIEQDADMVMFLYRPEREGITQDEQGQSTQGKAEVLISKHRNGRTGEVSLRFEEKYVRFEEGGDTGFSSSSTIPSRLNDDGDMGGVSNDKEDAPF